VTVTNRAIDLAGRATLRVMERGDPHGPAVVLLHGLGDSWRSFEPMLPFVPPSLHVLAVTHRGHGDASRPEDGYGLTDLSEDLLALLDALHIDRPVIVGHSMGGAVALRFAIDHPERTRGVVLISTPSTARGTPEARAHWERVLAALGDPIPRDFVREMTEQDFVKAVPPEVIDAMIDEGTKVPLRVWRGALEARWRADGDYASQLAQLRAPALILWGELDPRCPRAEQDALLAAIHGARLVSFEGAGHMLHIEEPERCAREITAFVT
jgi:pimeloyl-ACP methyl ester carboxylesterase